MAGYINVMDSMEKMKKMANLEQKMKLFCMVYDFVCF